MACNDGSLYDGEWQGEAWRGRGVYTCGGGGGGTRTTATAATFRAAGALC